MLPQNQLLLALALLLALSISSSSSTSLRIHKAANHWHPHPHQHHNQAIASARSRLGWPRGSGNSLPMSGGILSVGAYFLNITVGGQLVSVLFDTGSSNLVVPGRPPASTVVPCHSDACQKCTPDHAETAWASNTTCAFGPPLCDLGSNSCILGITYGGGGSYSLGTQYTGQVCLGQLCAVSSFTVSQSIPLPAAVEQGQQDLPIGLIGFASEFNSCNPTCVPTVLDNLVAANKASNVYGVCLTAENGGVVDVGFIDPKKYTGQLQYAPLEVERWFNLLVNDILVGNQSIGLPPLLYRTTNDCIGSFVDSGTSVVLLGPLIFQSLQTVFQNNYCALPGICGQQNFFNGDSFSNTTIAPYLAKYPDIEFVVQGTQQPFRLALPAASYLMFYNGSVSLGVVSNVGTPIILGDVFMQNYYIVFDRQNLQLGFAPVAKCV